MDVVATPAGAERVVGAGHRPELVVHLASGWIPEHPEGLGDLVEELSGPLVPEVDVGRVLSREPLIRATNLARPGGGRDAQHRVVVATHRTATSSCRLDPRSRRRRPRLPSGPSCFGSARPALPIRPDGSAPEPRGT